MSAARRHLRVVASDAQVAAPPVRLARLRSRLAGHRRDAIHGLETCVAQVAALRRQIDDPALDVMLNAFRAIERELRAIDPDGPIDRAALKTLVDALIALRAEVARFGALACGAAADGSPGPEQASVRR